MKKMTNKKDNKKPRPFSWMNPNLEIKETDGYDKGVFAKKDIKKGEILSVLGGHVFKASEELKLSGKISDYSLQINDDFVIGPVNNEEIDDSDYFNHNCSPNAGFNGQIFLVAMRNIKKWEQVTFDYAMVMSKAKNTKFYKMKCLCGAENCRGYVTDDDWKKSELQKKYKGYFQWYLQEKITKNKK